MNPEKRGDSSANRSLDSQGDGTFELHGNAADPDAGYAIRPANRLNPSPQGRMTEGALMEIS